MRTFPIGTGPYRFVRYDVDDKVVLSAFDGFWNGAPQKCRRDREGHPRRHDARSRSAQGGDRPRHQRPAARHRPPARRRTARSASRRRRVSTSPTSASTCGTGARRPARATRDRLRHRSRRDHQVHAARPGTAGIRAHPRSGVGIRAVVHRFTHDPARAMRLLDEAGYRDPDGEGPLPRLRLSLKISSNEETRLQSTVVQQNLRRVGIELDLRSYEFATFFADVLEGELSDVLVACGRAARLPIPTSCAGCSTPIRRRRSGSIAGYYRNRRCRSADRPRHAVHERGRACARHYRGRRKLIAEDAPYIPIWNRTNVIVAQPSLDGLHLNAIGDFQALKDVKRR